MEKRVYKYEIGDGGSFRLPLGSQILCVQTQNDEPFIWAIVDTSKSSEFRQFEIYGTGEKMHYDIGTQRKYIGTYQQNEGRLVWHLFEVII